MKKFRFLAQGPSAFHWRTLSESEEEQEAGDVEEDPKVETSGKDTEGGIINRKVGGLLERVREKSSFGRRVVGRYVCYERWRASEQMTHCW